MHGRPSSRLRRMKSQIAVHMSGMLKSLADEVRGRSGFNSDLAHPAIVGVCRVCQTTPEQ